MESDCFVGQVLSLLLQVGDDRAEVLESFLLNGCVLGHLLHLLGELRPSMLEAINSANDTRARTFKKVDLVMYVLGSVLVRVFLLTSFSHLGAIGIVTQ